MRLAMVWLVLMGMGWGQGMTLKGPSDVERSLRVAEAQLPVGRDIPRNAAAIGRAIDYAAAQRADVLVTPEGSLSGYTHEFDSRTARDALAGIVEKCRRARIALALGTCLEEDDGRRYDQVRLYDADGRLLGFHAKILLCRNMARPGSPGEVDVFATRPLRTFQLGGVTVGALVCNDMWANPEWTPQDDPFLARRLAALGARVVFLSINSGQSEGREWQLVRSFHESSMRLRARANRLFVVAADAADPAGRLPSNAPSGVLGPDGEWIVQADPRGEQFFCATIQLSE